jgi:hypothetical protein
MASRLSPEQHDALSTARAGVCLVASLEVQPHHRHGCCSSSRTGPRLVAMPCDTSALAPCIWPRGHRIRRRLAAPGSTIANAGSSDSSPPWTRRSNLLVEGSTESCVRWMGVRRGQVNQCATATRGEVGGKARGLNGDATDAER